MQGSKCPSDRFAVSRIVVLRSRSEWKDFDKFSLNFADLHSKNFLIKFHDVNQNLDHTFTLDFYTQHRHIWWVRLGLEILTHGLLCFYSLVRYEITSPVAKWDRILSFLMSNGIRTVPLGMSCTCIWYPISNLWVNIVIDRLTLNLSSAGNYSTF